MIDFFRLALFIFGFSVLFAFCPTAWSAEPKPRPPMEPPAKKMPDLGAPLVDHPEDLKRLHPKDAVWLDLKRNQVVLLGAVCHANYPLEFLATSPGREYESIVVVYLKPSTVHAGLLAVGAMPGRPASFSPKFEPASGTEIEINVRWKDKEGKRQQTAMREWIRNVRTKKPLDVNWVFAGSQLARDEDTGKNVYQADRGGEFISVLSLPGAMLDLPILSGSAIEARSFEAAIDRLPPKETPVTLILTPKLSKNK